MHDHISKKLIGLFFLGITGILLMAENTWAAKKAPGDPIQNKVPNLVQVMVDVVLTN